MDGWKKITNAAQGLLTASVYCCRGVGRGVGHAVVAATQPRRPMVAWHVGNNVSRHGGSMAGPHSRGSNESATQRLSFVHGGHRLPQQSLRWRWHCHEILIKFR